MESSAEPLVSLAQSMAERDPKKAKQYANLALERDSGSDEAWFALGLAENVLKNWPASAFAFDQVSPSSIFFALAANASASLYFEYLGHDQAAYQRFTQAARLAPNDLAIPSTTPSFFSRRVATTRRRLPRPGARAPGCPKKPGIRAAMSFVLFGAELLSGDRQRAAMELDEIEGQVKAVAAEAKVTDWVWVSKGDQALAGTDGKDGLTGADQGTPEGA